MSPIDISLINRKIRMVQDDYAKLLLYAKMHKEEYEKEYEHTLTVERLLERMIGRLIDINYHILKEDFNTFPPDYKTSFMELGKRNVLALEFSYKIALIAGLRNVLAHEYDEIDHDKIYAFLQSDLNDIPLYIKAILEYLDKTHV